MRTQSRCETTHAIGLNEPLGHKHFLAHVENIIGLEQDGYRKYTLATVPRSYNPLIWAFEKQPKPRFSHSKSVADCCHFLRGVL